MVTKRSLPVESVALSAVSLEIVTTRPTDTDQGHLPMVGQGIPTDTAAPSHVKREGAIDRDPGRPETTVQETAGLLDVTLPTREETGVSTMISISTDVHPRIVDMPADTRTTSTQETLTMATTATLGIGTEVTGGHLLQRSTKLPAEWNHQPPLALLENFKLGMTETETFLQTLGVS